MLNHLYTTDFMVFSGVCAQEVHLCGEASAIELIRQLTVITGDVLEIRKYKRLTSLQVLDRAVGKFSSQYK